MYFTIEQKELVTALESVKFAVSTRSTLPILGNVKITARDEFVVDFEATNLEAHARYVALAKGSVVRRTRHSRAATGPSRAGAPRAGPRFAQLRIGVVRVLE